MIPMIRFSDINKDLYKDLYMGLYMGLIGIEINLNFYEID